MIDREHRNQLAQLIRHLAIGRLSTHDYDQQSQALHAISKDAGLEEILWTVWTLYDDFRDHRFTGKDALPRELRRDLAKCILFLYSDQEYRWDEIRRTAAQTRWLNIMTLGLWNRLFAGDVVAKNRIAHDDAAWPFQTFAHLEDAKRHPHLLAAQ